MTEEARARRKAAVADVKRDLIRSAAKKLFAAAGLEATSVREIAKLAGYTTGAIYFYYGSKEDLYADILRESLDELFERVSVSAPRNADPVDALDGAFRALVAFYDDHPRDLDLSLYLLSGTRPRGLKPELNRELNCKFLAVLGIYRFHLARAGVDETRLNVEVAGLFDEMIGSLVASHTGRLRVIGTDIQSVVGHHTANLVARLRKRNRAGGQ